MNFKKGQIWKSEKIKAVITILEVSSLGTISFLIESEEMSSNSGTEWNEAIFIQYLSENEFKLQEK